MKESLKILKGLLLVFIMVMMMPIIVNAETIDVSDSTALKNYLNNGGDIRLVEDITLTANTAVNNDLIIDLNGHTLSMSDKTLIVYSNLTIKDSTNSGSVVSTGSWVMQAGGSGNTGNIILESGTIQGNGSYGISITAGSSMTVNGGRVLGKAYVIYNRGTFVINNGEVHATNDLVIQNHVDAYLEINGGTIQTDADYQAINLYGNCSATMNGGQILAPKCGTRYNGNGIALFKNTNLVINGGLISSCGTAVLGNGSVSGSSEGTNAKITVNGGQLISQDGLGIYAPQPNGETIINGGVITGRSGIEIRAGRLVVNGGTLNAIGDYEVRDVTSAASTLGAGISVAQHTTKLPIEVIVNNGVYNGAVPFSYTNPLNNGPEDIAKISITIAGGTYNSESDKSVVILNDEKVISGGLFTHDVIDNVVPEYGTYTKTNMYAVGKIHNVEIDDKSSDAISVDKERTPNGDVVTVKPVNKSGYRTIIEVIDENGNVVPVSNNKFIMPDGNVKIKVIYEKIMINPKTFTNATNIFIIFIIAIVFSGVIYYKKRKRFN